MVLHIYTDAHGINITCYVLLLLGSSIEADGKQVSIFQMYGLFLMLMVAFALAALCLPLEYVAAAYKDIVKDRMQGVSSLASPKKKSGRRLSSPWRVSVSQLQGWEFESNFRWLVCHLEQVTLPHHAQSRLLGGYINVK